MSVGTERQPAAADNSLAGTGRKRTPETGTA
ncbi:MAG: hypothetical protein QOE51_3875 [Actinoplanes sp.]|jgi:hypothetical protein|nr:hypothetical protein [Actinoplanes sp.]